MNIADGLALTSYTRNVHPDGWIGRETTLHILTYQAFRTLMVELWIPDHLEGRPIFFTTDGWSGESELKPGEITQLSLPCAPSPGGLTLRITIPDAQTAAPPDGRVLGAVLHALSGTRL